MSTLSVACPYCQKQIKVPERLVGKQIQCPGCKQGLKLEGAGGPTDRAGQGGNDFSNLAQESGRSHRPSAFWELLTFRRMIAPFVLQLVFWLAVLGTIGSGAVMVIFGILAMTASAASAPAAAGGNAPPGFAEASAYGGGAMIFSGLLTMVFGPLVIRVYFEMLIMVFRVYDVLREIRDKVDRR